MVCKELSRLLQIDQGRQLRLAREHLCFKPVTIGADNPRADRSRETTFGSSEQFVRQPTCSSATKQMLPSGSGSFERFGQTECELDDAAIEQRAADLEAVLHA